MTVLDRIQRVEAFDTMSAAEFSAIAAGGGPGLLVTERRLESAAAVLERPVRDLPPRKMRLTCEMGPGPISHFFHFASGGGYGMPSCSRYVLYFDGS